MPPVVPGQSAEPPPVEEEEEVVEPNPVTVRSNVQPFPSVFNSGDDAWTASTTLESQNPTTVEQAKETRDLATKNQIPYGTAAQMGPTVAAAQKLADLRKDIPVGSVTANVGSIPGHAPAIMANPKEYKRLEERFAGLAKDIILPDYDGIEQLRLEKLTKGHVVPQDQLAFEVMVKARGAYFDEQVERKSLFAIAELGRTVGATLTTTADLVDLVGRNAKSIVNEAAKSSSLVAAGVWVADAMDFDLWKTLSRSSQYLLGATGRDIKDVSEGAKPTGEASFWDDAAGGAGQLVAQVGVGYFNRMLSAYMMAATGYEKAKGFVDDTNNKADAEIYGEDPDPSALQDTAIVLSALAVGLSEKAQLELVLDKLPSKYKSGIVTVLGGMAAEPLQSAVEKVLTGAIAWGMIDEKYISEITEWSLRNDLLLPGVLGAGMGVFAHVTTPSQVMVDVNDIAVEAQELAAVDQATALLAIQQNLDASGVKDVKINLEDLLPWMQKQPGYSPEMLDLMGITPQLEAISDPATPITVKADDLAEMMLNPNFAALSPSIAYTPGMPSATAQAKTLNETTPEAIRQLEEGEAVVTEEDGGRTLALLKKLDGESDPEVIADIMSKADVRAQNTAKQLLDQVEQSNKELDSVIVEGLLNQIEADRRVLDQLESDKIDEILYREENGLPTVLAEKQLDKIQRDQAALDSRQDFLEIPDRVAELQQLVAETIPNGSAAVRINGKVYTGQLHTDAIEAAIADGVDPDAAWNIPQEDQQFVTDTGRWVDRNEAMDIIKALDPDADIVNAFDWGLMAEELGLINEGIAAKAEPAPVEPEGLEGFHVTPHEFTSFQDGKSEGGTGIQDEAAGFFFGRSSKVAEWYKWYFNQRPDKPKTSTLRARLKGTEADYLRSNTRIGSQSQKIQDAVAILAKDPKYIEGRQKEFDEAKTPEEKKRAKVLLEAAQSNYGNGFTGKEFYEFLVNREGYGPTVHEPAGPFSVEKTSPGQTKQEAGIKVSKLLSKAGIKGLIFEEAMVKGEESIVVFDKKDITIVEKDGVSTLKAINIPTKATGFSLDQDAVGIVSNQREFKEQTPFREVTPDQFLAAAEEIAAGTEKTESIAFLAQTLQEGGKVATPFITLQQTADKGVWKVVGHEGRHRAMAAKQLGLPAIPVQLFLKDANGNRITDPKALTAAAKIVSQDGKAVSLKAEPAPGTPKPSDLVLTKAGVLDKHNVKTTKKSVAAVRKMARTAKAVAKTDMKGAQKLLTDMLAETDLKGKDLEVFNTTIREIDSYEKLVKALPKIQMRVLKRVDKARKREVKRALKKIGDAYKPTISGDKPMSKIGAEAQDMVGEMKTILSRTQAESEVALAEQTQRNVQMAEEGDTPQPFADITGALLQLQADPDNASADKLEQVLEDIHRFIAEGKALRTAQTDAQRAEVQEMHQDLMASLPAERTETKGKLAEKTDRMEAMLWLHPTSNWSNKLKKIMGTSDNALASRVLAFSDLTQNGIDLQTGHNKRSSAYVNAYADAFGIDMTKPKKGLSKVLTGLQKDETTVLSIGDGYKYQHADHLDAEGNVETEGISKQVSMTKGEARQLLMEWRDPGQRENLTNPQGDAYTPEIIEAIRAEMTPQDNLFMDAQVQFYNTYYNDINKQYVRMYGMNLPKIENYVPVSKAWSDAQQVNDEWLKNIAYRGAYVPHSLKKRSKSSLKRKVRSDYATMRNHMTEMEYWLAYGEKTRQLNTVFNHEAFNRIEDAWGKSVADTIRGDLMDFSNKGVNSATTLDQFWHRMIRNYGFKVLAMKPTIFAKQLVSTLTFSTEQGVSSVDYMEGMALFMANPNKAAEVLRGSQWYKDRGQAIDADLQAITNEMHGSNWTNIMGRNPSLAKFMMTNIRWGDKMAITAGGYAMVHSLTKRGVPLKEAIRRFEVAANATQQSSFIDQQSALQRDKNPAYKLVTQFQSSAAAIARAEYAAIIDWKRGRLDNKGIAKQLLVLHVAIPQIILAISSFGLPDWEEVAMTAVTGPFGAGAIVWGTVFEGFTKALISAVKEEGWEEATERQLKMRHLNEWYNIIKGFDASDWEDVFSTKAWLVGNKTIETIEELLGLLAIPATNIHRGVAGGVNRLNAKTDREKTKGTMKGLGFTDRQIKKELDK